MVRRRDGGRASNTLWSRMEPKQSLRTGISAISSSNLDRLDNLFLETAARWIPGWLALLCHGVAVTPVSGLADADPAVLRLPGSRVCLATGTLTILPVASSRIRSDSCCGLPSSSRSFQEWLESAGRDRRTRTTG